VAVALDVGLGIPCAAAGPWEWSARSRRGFTGDQAQPLEWHPQSFLSVCEKLDKKFLAVLASEISSIELWKIDFFGFAKMKGHLPSSHQYVFEGTYIHTLICALIYVHVEMCESS